MKNRQNPDRANGLIREIKVAQGKPTNVPIYLTSEEQDRLRNALDSMLADNDAMRLEQMQFLTAYLLEHLSGSLRWCIWGGEWDDVKPATVYADDSVSSTATRNRVLAGLAMYLVSKLNADPEEFRKLAETSSEWPMLVGAHKNTAADRRREALQNELGIGTKTQTMLTRPSSGGGRPTGANSLRSQAFLPLFNRVNMYRAAPPEIRRRGEWFNQRFEDHLSVIYGNCRQVRWQKMAEKLPQLSKDPTVIKLWEDTIWELIQFEYQGPDGAEPAIHPRVLALLWPLRDLIGLRGQLKNKQAGEENLMREFLIGCAACGRWPISDLPLNSYVDADRGGVEVVIPLEHIPIKSAAKLLPKVPDRWSDASKGRLDFFEWWKVAGSTAGRWLAYLEACISWDAHARFLAILPDLSALGHSHRKFRSRRTEDWPLEKLPESKLQKELRGYLEALAPSATR